MTSDFFETWFKCFLLPSLKELCESEGHRLLPLPPYSPDYNPIEKTWAHMKKYLRKVLPNYNTFQRLLCPCLISIDYNFGIFLT